IHPGLNRVVLKALAKNPQTRYQLGADLVQALENHESVSEAEAEDAPKPIPAAVFNFPQQAAAAPAPARTPPPRRARNGTPATPKAVMGRVPGKKPLVAQKSIPLLPVVIAVLAVVIVVVSGVIVYVKHEQARQRAEMERLLQQKNAAGTEETPLALAPESAPTPTPLASSQAPSLEEPREPSPWQKPRHTASLSPKHTSAMMNLGEMVLSTQPDSADVTIDGVSQSDWRTPFTATAVSPGPHTVIFSKNGYASETRVVEVKAVRPAFLPVTL